jgi:hypothetical protein
MKMQSHNIRHYVLVGLILVVCLASLSSAASTVQRWNVNFENGFTASSGDPCDIGGNLGSPNDPCQPVHLVTDLDTITGVSSKALQVGTGTSPACLLYTNLPLNVLGYSGKVALDFKITNTADTSMRTLFSNAGNLIAEYYWHVSLFGVNEVIVRSQDDIESPGEIQYSASIAALAAGWHHAEFTWVETVLRDEAMNRRERANITMVIDGQQVLNDLNVYWTMPNNTSLTVGSFTSKPDASSGFNTYFRCGDAGILIDNVVVSDFVPQNCGDTYTVYLPGDMNKDCSVNFADFAKVAKSWMQCSDPNNSNCSTKY